ncbi:MULTISPECIES: lysophospholipid acyltransferase family protein [Marinobacter]|jgi:KDO2-lipid IV(A) lauroyltransferase|uniref:Lipid A biosynthesis acyltransferase n=2 Tax=Marinobacter nauticus TaxID=2743 RepID=A1TYS1_MARN8|nr:MULTISPECIES: lysophospholipid acyltransferase family protein [Marinobacter]MEC8898771.1 lysophospholipid acyltransferase family protein [Pseudomonadota bacterium]ABM17890.1 lipid A biosynthesis acyltransferase [Marinobacter nauticus VT8]ERS87477.1 lipid A biosynthesis acyltransferase [Marinobacter sp. C1S70]KAE8544623.1 Lipid A biosynthesis lauroyl acyltransferase [Marinobacter nauticus]MAC23222.1 lipid A biosynthesis acyltransferase [Marinobacter sp.]|tara:strand:+ start:9512 stop:10420 length:909 start_codon:yes stop_codon:yes gene_type:complete
MSKFKYYLIAGLLRMVSYLPLGAAQFIGKWLGLLAWKLGGRPKKITDINLDICLPELTEEQRRDLSRDSLAHTGMTALEIPLMWEWPVDKCLGLIKETEGLELVDEALATGKGLILLAPHLGNWELAGLFFSSRYKMAALYSPPHIKEFEDYMIRVRGRLGSELVRGDRKGLMRLMGILKEGGVAGILPDQSPRGKTNAYAPFFGMDVMTMTLVGKLVQKTGANVLVTYAERLPNGEGFKILVTPAEPGIGADDAVAGATALNQSVEKVVRMAPEQYQWEYKRMRHRPPGNPNPYKPGQICD